MQQQRLLGSPLGNGLGALPGAEIVQSVGDNRALLVSAYGRVPGAMRAQSGPRVLDPTAVRTGQLAPASRFHGWTRRLESRNYDLELVDILLYEVSNSIKAAMLSHMDSASITPPSTKMADPLEILASVAGSLDGPPDWAAQLDHYLYGTPKR